MRKLCMCSRRITRVAGGPESVRRVALACGLYSADATLSGATSAHSAAAVELVAAPHG